MVEFVVVAVADRAALINFGGEFLGEGAFELFKEGREIVEACRQCRDGGSGEFEEGGGDGGEGLEGFTDPAQFAGAAQAVLESPENTLEVADAPQLGLKLRSKSLASDKFRNALLAALDFREGALGRGEPAFKATGAGSGHGGVHRGEEGTLAGIGSGLEDFEAAEGGGVEEEGLLGAEFAELAQVFRLGAEGFGGVMDEGSGGAEGRVFAGDAKAVEVEDAEGVHYGLNPGFGFKMIIREGGAGAVAAKILKALRGGAGVIAPGGTGFFRQQNFARVDAFEGGKEIFGVGLGGEEEFAGGEVEPGGLEVVFAEVKGEEEMVTLRFDLAVGEAGTGRDDAGEFAFDEFAGLRCFNLVADGDFDALVEELLNIIIGGMVGDACHGHPVAIG